MFTLAQKLSPDEFIKTFFDANRQDHQRQPTHPWEELFRNGKCSREQLQGWGKERYYFTKQVPIKEYSILYNCPHTDVEVEHGLIRKKILQKYADTKELQEACINAQLMKNNMRRVMADCIYMTYVVQGIKCEPASVAA